MGTEIDGAEYEFFSGSDVDRDGMYLEVFSPSNEGRELLGEIFYSDEHKTFSLSLFKEGVPLAVVEELISAAKRVLPLPEDVQIDEDR